MLSHIPQLFPRSSLTYRWVFPNALSLPGMRINTHAHCSRMRHLADAVEGAGLIAWAYEHSTARRLRIHRALCIQHAAHVVQGSPHQGPGLLQFEQYHPDQHRQCRALLLRLRPPGGASVAAAQLLRGDVGTDVGVVPAIPEGSR